MTLKLRYLYRAYRYRWRVDPAEVRFVRQCLQPGQVAADIGCHKGAYTYWMRRRVGPFGAVYAFEPQPRQVAYLRQAFSAMRYDNVAIIPMAVSYQCGEMPLHVPTGAGMTHAASLEPPSRAVGWASPTTMRDDKVVGSAHPTSPTLFVNVTTLDDFFADQPQGPNFLKIDVEGHELSVLEGAREILKKHRPSILLECESRHRPDGDVGPVFDLLQSLGYEGSYFQCRVRRPLAEFDAGVHQRIDAANPEQLPQGYVNNFAFVPAR